MQTPKGPRLPPTAPEPRPAQVSDPNLAAMGYDQTADLWSLGVVLRLDQNIAMSIDPTEITGDHVNYLKRFMTPLIGGVGP